MSFGIGTLQQQVNVGGNGLRNSGPDALYYRAAQPVTASLNDGSLDVGQSATLDGNQWIVSAGRSSVDILPAVALQGVVGAIPNGDPFRFDSTRLGAFRAALANRATAGVNVLCIGHSICEGDHANLSTRWQAVLRDALRTRYPTSGVTGGVGSLPPQYMGGTLDGNLTGSLPVTSTGTITTTAGTGLGKRAVRFGTGATLTFSLPTCTGFDISYLKGSSISASLPWSIDAASQTAINGNQASTANGLQQVRGLVATTHTLLFTGPASSQWWVQDVMVYNGDESAGIRFMDAGHSGNTAGDFLESTTNGTAYGAYTAFGDPHLIIVESGGINEWGTVDTLRKTPRQMQEDLFDLIDGISGNCAARPSIIMFEDHKRGAPTSAFRGRWERYTDGVRRVAREVGATLFDSQAVLGDASVNANGLFASDLTHPLAAGHTALANALDQLIASA